MTAIAAYLMNAKGAYRVPSKDSNLYSFMIYKDINLVNAVGISRSLPKLDPLPKISLGKLTLVSSAQISPCTTVKINGSDFDLVTRDNDTIYLTTNDKRFQTPEGYKVGTRLSELPKNIQQELTEEPGWGYYYKLSSGWTLGFCEGNSCTDNYPQKNSKVKWIFKRE